MDLHLCEEKVVLPTHSVSFSPSNSVRVAQPIEMYSSYFARDV